MDNPVFHQYPAFPMTAYMMHKELGIRHFLPQCTLISCDMKRYCWTALDNLGHRPEAAMLDDCPVCEGSTHRRHEYPLNPSLGVAKDVP